MKKLLVMVIGAAAAFGASAIEDGVRFEGLERQAITADQLNTAAGNTYWSELANSTNTYTVEEMGAYTTGGGHPAAFVGPGILSSTNALNVKTTFGKPLSFKANTDGTGASIGAGLYFDSLVKFTVCEEPPEETYDGAKIVMWLQERYNALDDTIVEGTNLMVKAGFLSFNESIQVSPFVYTCGNTIDADFADKWHRVTIKAIGDITNGGGVPGFAIYIDGENVGGIIKVHRNEQDAWDSSFANHYSLNEVARNIGTALFPSMVQGGDSGKSTLTSVGFDGTGSINELLFTATAPDFADDEQYFDDKFSLQIGSATPVPYKTLGAAVEAVNALGSGVDCTLSLVSGFAFNGPVAFNTAANLVLDLNGFAITNSSDSGYAITVADSTYMTITDSSGAKTGAIVSDIAALNSGAIFISAEGSLTLTGGTIDGWIERETRVIEEETTGECILMGGAVKQDNIDPADGFALVARGETDFFDVVPAFTVTFKDGDVVLTNILNVATNTAAADISGIPADPSQSGKTFTGWSPALADTVIVSNTTFTAQYDTITYNIYFAYGEGLATTSAVQVVNYGETPVAPDAATVAVAGKTFTGWSPAVAAATADLVYEAQYTVNTYNIYFAYGEGLATTSAVQVVNYGETPVAPDAATVAVAGKTFTGWSPAVAAATADLVYEAQYNAITYTVKFISGEGSTTQTVEKTYNQTIESGDVETPAVVSGKTFTAWDPAISFPYTVTADATFTAQYESSGPAPIDPANPQPVDVKAESDVKAIEAVVLTPPSGSSVAPAVYKENFDFSAVPSGEGEYTVTLTGIKESVKTDVSEDAVAVLTSASGTGTVEVPAGLYYRITRYTAIGTAVVEPPAQGLSDGTAVNVDKPGTDQGFIKVEMATVPFN